MGLKDEVVLANDPNEEVQLNKDINIHSCVVNLCNN